ncbi:MAG: helix-turn-helix domain-containing protein [Candidatus Binatus sp.]|uniref:helix-turn-helix domain-containing protein n=1 Tax=Candidatus Binatus sp. TaxID=2811406 RepID=UPI002728A80E|nr:helix-turn-helix domain-containing protein [Candidatus Binatus sp.]MDO8432705.1 helix-turn-helix domain-containing protein [Candidatus Binatus sp.]
MTKELRGAGRGEKAKDRSASRDGQPIQNNPVREFYTVSQLADLLQLTEMTIYRMIGRGELPCYAIGRIKRFRRGDVEEFLEQCRVQGTAKQLAT